MNIIIDENNINLNKKGLITCEIYLKTKKTYFPCEHWNDFTSVILGWWCYEFLNALMYERDFEMCFMDGPYRISGKQCDNRGYILSYIKTDCHKVICTERMSCKNIKEELLKACKIFFRITEKNNMHYSNEQGLKVFFDKLKKL